MHGLNNVHVNKLGISQGDLNYEIWYYTYNFMGKNKTKAWPFTGQFKINIPRFKRKENRKKFCKI